MAYIEDVKSEITRYHDPNLTLDLVYYELNTGNPQDWTTLINDPDPTDRRKYEDKAYTFAKNDKDRAAHVQSVGQYVEQDSEQQEQQWISLEQNSVSNPEINTAEITALPTASEQLSTAEFKEGDIRNNPVLYMIEQEAEQYGLSLEEIKKYDPKGYAQLPTDFDFERRNEYYHVRELEGRPYNPPKTYDSGVKGLLEKYDDNYQSVTDALAESEQKLLPSSTKILGLGAEAAIIALIIGALTFKFF